MQKENAANFKKSLQKDDRYQTLSTKNISEKQLP